MPVFDNVEYPIQPSTVTTLQGLLEREVKYGSLAMQNLPNEQSLQVITKNYETWRTTSQSGVGFELEVVTPPDSTHRQIREAIETPVLFSNFTMTYDQYLEYNQDPYSLATRMADQIAELQTRADLITYIGDSKYSINKLSTTNLVGDEVSTQLDVSSPTNARSTFATALKQLRSNLKYSGTWIGSNSTVMVEMTPDIYSTAQGKTTATEDLSALGAVQQILNETFPNGNSRVVENPYLDGSFTVDDAGVHSITVGDDCILIYLQDPRIMKTVTSPMQIRMSPLDETKGLTIQPVMRLSRWDGNNIGGENTTTGTRGVLIETDVAVA